MNRFFTRSELATEYRHPQHVLEQLLVEIAPVEKNNQGEPLFLEAHVDAWLTARYSPLQGRQVDGPALVPDLPREVSTEEAAIILGVSKDTVLKLRSSGVLPFRNAAPPGSTRPAYRFPLEAVVKLRMTYDTEEQTPDFPKEGPRRVGKEAVQAHRLRLNRHRQDALTTWPFNGADRGATLAPFRHAPPHAPRDAPAPSASAGGVVTDSVLHFALARGKIPLVGNFFLWPLCELPDFCLRGTTARTPPGNPA